MSGCKNPQAASIDPQMRGEGVAMVKITAAANSPFNLIARGAIITISAPDMLTMTRALVVTDTSVQGTVTGIPAGKNRLFQVNVYDSLETIQYKGQANANVIADSMVSVTISIYRVGGGAIINGTVIEGPSPNDSGPTAYWNFDSTSANTYYDVTGHGYNALSTGTGLSCVPGVLGNALSCPSSGFEITVANSKDSFAFKKFTVESWYYASSIPTNGQLKILNFDYLVSGVRNGWTFCIVEGGYADFTLSSADGGQWVNAQSLTAVTPNKWYHIAGSYDGSNLRIYVNGILESTVPYSGGVIPCGIDARLGCQRLMDGTVRFEANGKIDELKVYNYALSSSSILSHYNAIVPPQNSSALIASWSFDSVSSNTYYDVTRHGYNAVSMGAGLTLAQGKKGQALSFSGSSFDCVVQNSSEIFNSNKFTIETWYYSNANPALGTSLGQIFNYQLIASGVRNGYGLYVEPNGIIDFGMASKDGSYYTDVFSSTVFKQQTWYHIAAVYDSLSLKVFINGVLEGSVPQTGGYLAPHANARIGCQSMIDGTIFGRLNATLDELDCAPKIEIILKEIR
jgi:hypothetical protein